jgi:hypothetical protein
MVVRLSAWLRAHRPFARRASRPVTEVDLAELEANRRRKDEKLSIKVWEHSGGQGNPTDMTTGRF